MNVKEDCNRIIEQVMQINLGEYSSRGENVHLDQLKEVFHKAYMLGITNHQKMVNEVFEDHKTNFPVTRIGRD